MVKLGLGPATIRTKIESSRSNFDTSPSALARLQSAGVPSEVIQAMIRAGAPGAGTAAGAQGGRQVFVLKQEGGVETAITPVRVTAEISQRKRWIPVYGAFANAETFMTIQGAKAAVASSSSPEFLTSMDPLKVRLVHLADNGKNGRYVVFDGNSSDREIKIDHQDAGGGLYRIKPGETLKPGEQYAFLIAPELPSGMGFWAWFAQPGMAAMAYDFSVK